MRAAASASFLGRGWGFPPELSVRTDEVRMVAGLDDIEESLQILLGTIPGERVMLPTYGCDLHTFLFHELDAGLAARIADCVETAIRRWEPRIDLTSVQATLDSRRPGLVRVELSFMVRRTNIRSNIVYPFYLTEATLPREA